MAGAMQNAKRDLPKVRIKPTVVFRDKLIISFPLAICSPRQIRDEEREGQFGSVFGVSGPVVIAENMRGASMYELVSTFRVITTIGNAVCGCEERCSLYSG